MKILWIYLKSTGANQHGTQFFMLGEIFFNSSKWSTGKVIKHVLKETSQLRKNEMDWKWFSTKMKQKFGNGIHIYLHVSMFDNPFIFHETMHFSCPHSLNSNRMNQTQKKLLRHKIRIAWHNLPLPQMLLNFNHNVCCRFRLKFASGFFSPSLVRLWLVIWFFDLWCVAAYFVHTMFSSICKTSVSLLMWFRMI